MIKPRSLSDYDRAMLRVTLASAPGVFTNEDVRGLLGADETCMTCPLCGTGRVGGKLCQEFRCDECNYAFAKST
jgi:transposase-like protein